MFSNIIRTILLLVTNPSNIWKELFTKYEESVDNKNKFLDKFIYPLIALNTLAAFFGVILHNDEIDIQIAMKEGSIVLVTSFAGFFLASFLLNEFLTWIARTEKNIKQCRYYIGYNMSIVFAVSIIMSIIPEFFFLKFFLIYTLFIMWEGSKYFMKVPDNRQALFVVITAILIYFSPYLIEIIMFKLMPGMKITN